MGGAPRIPHDAREVLEAARIGCARGSWLEKIFACLAGELLPSELAAAADPENPEQVCEGYYYAGEVCLLNGRLDEARKWFQLCAATQLVLDPDSTSLDAMNEYHVALWRLDLPEAGDRTAPRRAPE